VLNRLEHSDLKGVIVESEPRDYQEVMDDALQLVYSHHHRLVTQLAPEAFKALTLEQLRNGPLGQDLLRLARLAGGQTREPKEQVLEAIDSVLQILFWPAAADDYTVPRTFWDTDLGRMLALAKYRSYEANELVSIGNAAQQLGVTRPTIYRWMDDRTLNYVRDDMSGRTFVVRRDIDQLKRIALEADGQI
jgi:excisionase family DNA binding protein